MIFAALALTFVVAVAATGLAQPLLEMEGSFPVPPTVASNSTLLLPRRALTAGADACTGNSTGLPAAECSAWQDMYDGTGGTAWGGQNASVGVIVHSVPCLD
jgi:hypothetical protein